MRPVEKTFRPARTRPDWTTHRSARIWRCYGTWCWPWPPLAVCTTTAARARWFPNEPACPTDDKIMISDCRSRTPGDGSAARSRHRLITDGLIEDRDVALSDNLERLRLMPFDIGLEKYSADVLAEFGHREDDVAMIVVCRLME